MNRHGAQFVEGNLINLGRVKEKVRDHGWDRGLGCLYLRECECVRVGGGRQGVVRFAHYTNNFLIRGGEATGVCAP